VGGTGLFTPTLISLFSFNLPLEPFGHTVSSALGDVRLGISTGPVLQLSSSQATASGWFVGGSLSFLKYIYLTLAHTLDNLQITRSDSLLASKFLQVLEP
jgi:hypothetical protein